VTGRLHPEAEPLLAPHQPLGVFPFPLFHCRERRRGRKGRGGEKKDRAAAHATPRRLECYSWTRAGVARTGAVVPWRLELCESKEPEPRERRHREHLRRHRERLHRAGHDYTADPT
jgi:hypothetical protein